MVSGDLARWTVEDAALAASRPGRVWMRPDEFEAIWRARFHNARAPRPTGVEAIGLNRRQADRIIDGTRAVRKIEALAIAHFMLELPPPVDVGDHAAFGDWLARNVGAKLGPMNDWLEMPNNSTLADYARGYMMHCGSRIPRAPTITLLRAVDLAVRAGPFCPYGGERP